MVQRAGAGHKQSKNLTSSCLSPEDIGERVSAYRDTRWPEREEVNRQIIELKVLSERTKDLIRKSCSQ